MTPIAALCLLTVLSTAKGDSSKDSSGSSGSIAKDDCVCRPGTKKSLETAITEGNGRLMTGYNNDDMDIFASVLTDDVQVLAQDFSILNGPQEVVAFFSPTAAFASLAIKTLEVWGPMCNQKGHMFGIERGVSIFFSEMGTASFSDKFMTMWKYVGNEWKIQLHIYNTPNA